MIDIVMSGMCEGCEYADLVLDVVSSSTTGDGGGIPVRKSWMIECSHLMACLAMKKKMQRQTLSEHPEIVRCKDCKHRDPEDKKCDCGHDILWQLPRDADWFCADAERREAQHGSD